MKQDKFLIGIVIGIVALIIVALVVVLLRAPENEEYVADDSPAGVVHNYVLAIQRRDYERAYSYLADELEQKPDLDKFIRDVNNFGDRGQHALQVGETHLGDERAQVDVSITTYSRGGFPGLFDSSSYTNQGTAFLRQTDDGWKLLEFPYPYWGYDWNQVRP